MPSPINYLFKLAILMRRYAKVTSKVHKNGFDHSALNRPRGSVIWQLELQDSPLLGFQKCLIYWVVVNTDHHFSNTAVYQADEFLVLLRRHFMLAILIRRTSGLVHVGRV
jgi:hypothetical protein